MNQAVADDALRVARFRDRVANIFEAAKFAAPSYPAIDLWSQIETGDSHGPKPPAEYYGISKAKRDYDTAIWALTQGYEPRVGGIIITPETAQDTPSVVASVAEFGAEPYAVVLAGIVSQIIAGRPVPNINPEAHETLVALIDIAQAGDSEPLKEAYRELLDE